MAFRAAILPAARLPHHPGVLPVADPHRPAFSTTVFTTATPERTGIIFHLLHRLFLCHLQTTQRAVLDPGNRVAILYALAIAGAGYAPGCLAGQTAVSFAYDCRLSPGSDCLGPLLTLLWHLLCESAFFRNLPGPPLHPQWHPALYLWRQWEISGGFWCGNAAGSLFRVYAASLDVAERTGDPAKAESLAVGSWLALPVYHDPVELQSEVREYVATLQQSASLRALLPLKRALFFAVLWPVHPRAPLRIHPVQETV